MNVHHNNREIILVVGILELQDCLEIDAPAADHNAQVKVKAEMGIFRPLFLLLIDLAAALYLVMQNATDFFQRILGQFATQPLMGPLLEHDIVRVSGDKSFGFVPQHVPVTAQSPLCIVGKRHLLLLVAFALPGAVPCRSHNTILAPGCVKSMEKIDARTKPEYC
jgi:hypothetical protein